MLVFLAIHIKGGPMYNFFMLSDVFTSNVLFVLIGNQYKHGMMGGRGSQIIAHLHGNRVSNSTKTL